MTKKEKRELASRNTKVTAWIRKEAKLEHPVPSLAVQEPDLYGLGSGAGHEQELEEDGGQEQDLGVPQAAGGQEDGKTRATCQASV